MKILIVEDELLIAHASRMHLESRGYEVIGLATDGRSFAEFMKQEPDAILMDISLKHGENGITLVNEIRDMGNLTPVIFTTGNSRSKTLEEIESIPKSCVLSKPVVFQELMKKIEQCYNEMKK